MGFWASFWDIIWWFLWIFAFTAYLFALFAIIGDLFRDRKLNGWYKAVWFIFLIIVPFLTALVYLIARGDGMAERSRAEIRKAQAETDEYIKHVAGKSPSEEIAHAAELLKSGVITDSEYERLKAKALS